MRRGLVISLVIAAGTAALAAPAGFTVQDLVAMDRLSELASSSAHSRLAFTVSTLDREANRRRSDIWTVDARDGGAPVRLTADPASDTSPVWSPDGQAIYFLSSRSGSSQVWRMSGSQAGEATQVTKYPLDVGAFRLSPDGRQLAVALEVYVDCADLSCTADRVAAAEKRKATGRLYDSLLFRHWDTWKDGRRSHLFVAPVDMFEKTTNAAAAVDVMQGMDADSPSKPFGGAEEFTFTPDSREHRLHGPRRRARGSVVDQPRSLGRADRRHGGKPRNLTAQNKGTDTGPVFSPDGTLAGIPLHGAGRATRPTACAIRVLQWDTQVAVAKVADGWDRSPNELVWSSNGKVLYATAQDVGQQSLFAIDVAAGTAKALLAKGTVSAPVRVKTAAADAIAVLVDDLRSPAEVQVVSTDAAAGAPIVRTSFNKDRVAATAMGDAEQFSFPGWNGETVHGYVVKPADFDAGEEVPGRVPDPRRPAGLVRQPLPLPLEPADLRRRRLRRRDDRLPRLDRLRPGASPTRSAATGAASRSTICRRGSTPRSRSTRGSTATRVCALGASLRRLHDQLDRRQLAGPLQVPRQPRRQPRRADGLLRHRGAVVPRVGARRHAVGEPGRLREAQPDRPRRRSGRRRCSSSTAAATTASSTRRACRRSPRCSARASRAASCTSPTRTTGC